MWLSKNANWHHLCLVELHLSVQFHLVKMNSRSELHSPVSLFISQPDFRSCGVFSVGFGLGDNDEDNGVAVPVEFSDTVKLSSVEFVVEFEGKAVVGVVAVDDMIAR